MMHKSLILKIGLMFVMTVLAVGCVGHEPSLLSKTLLYKNALNKTDLSKTTLNKLKPLAEQGNPDVQFKLGLMYGRGKGVPKDNKLAFKWFHKSAEQGNSDAQLLVGLMYGIGIGYPRDFFGVPEVTKPPGRWRLFAKGDTDGRERWITTIIIKWIEKSAHQGNADGQYGLGVLYHKGHDDYMSGIEWYRKSAEQGNAAAQYELGLTYLNGYFNPKDENIALKWFRKSAKQGNALAQKALKTVLRK